MRAPTIRSYLVALFKALPHARTVDDCEALLPWRLSPAAD